MEAQKQFSAAVLAGGYSSRMGRDKAALSFGGTTMLDQQVRKLRSVGIEDIMISGSELAVSGTRYVPDVFPHRGPLSGIHACLQAARGKSVLFLSVDVPLVPVEALSALLDAHANGVTLIRHGDRIEPLIGVYDRTLLRICEKILGSDKTAVKQLLEHASVHTILRADNELFYTNCNTEADYLFLCSHNER
ncbi:MAG: molybdenum cofactor guanylyltransferase [Oscillospiraceae bacterium]|nr:molybdenum cofactor guanylyltransferase [Oscillospiraceae bacterium]